MGEKIKALVLSGGLYHPFERTTARLVEHLNASGQIEATATDDLKALGWSHLQDYDVLTLNCLRCWSRDGETTPETVKDGVLRHVEAGKGVVAIHAAALNFEDWHDYRNMLGGFWEQGRSSHGPYEPGIQIKVVHPHHPITRSVGDFTIHDELYHTLTLTAHVRLLMTALWEGKIQPMGWTHTYGQARIHYNALGHGVETLQSPELMRLYLQGVLWVAGRE
jgi:hypothetical protein